MACAQHALLLDKAGFRPAGGDRGWCRRPVRALLPADPRTIKTVAETAAVTRADPDASDNGTLPPLDPGGAAANTADTGDPAATPPGSPQSEASDSEPSPAGSSPAGSSRPDRPPPGDHQPVSVIIGDFLDGWRGDTVSVGDIIAALGNRGYAVLMLILALPNLFPIYIPGLSPVTGLPLIYLCWQLVIGRPVPRLPDWLRSRAISTQRFAGVMRRVLPALRGVERVSRARLTALVSMRGERMIGIGCLLLLAILINPLPATNWLPALAICCAALAILERDGLFVLVAILVGIGAVAFFITYIDILLYGIVHVIERATALVTTD